MKKLITSLLIKLFKINKEDVLAVSQELKNHIKKPKKNLVKMFLAVDEPINNTCSVEPVLEKEIKTKPKKVLKQKTPKLPELTPKERAARDISEMMEVPFLALSKNRKKPIIYEKNDGENIIKVNVFPSSNGFVASIYDWDIILFVAGKIQKVLNDGSDIPPRTIIVPRHEILRSLKKYDGKKQELDLNNALSRLQSTTVETTIGNKQYKKGKVFSFLDSWGYTDRKDVREIEITLSDWLYQIVCTKGALLMVDPGYFSITSGLKRFLYRTARKHVGIKGGSWEFLIETLYEKSGSEQNFRYFKSDLKKTVLDNDIPGYNLEWIEKENKVFVKFNHINFEESKSLSN